MALSLPVTVTKDGETIAIGADGKVYFLNAAGEFPGSEAGGSSEPSRRAPQRCRIERHRVFARAQDAVRFRRRFTALRFIRARDWPLPKRGYNCKGDKAHQGTKMTFEPSPRLRTPCGPAIAPPFPPEHDPEKACPRA